MSAISVPLESKLKYLQRRTVELEQVQNSLTQNPDWELVKKIGHQIKGNAATFGFPELADFGNNLEVTAALADVEKAHEVSGRLHQEVRRLLRSIS